MFTEFRKFACLFLLVLGVTGSAMSVAGPMLYGVTGANNQDSYLYTINPLTGATSLIGDTGYSHVTGIDFDPTTGILYGVQSGGGGNNQLLTIDAATGAATVIGATGAKVPDITFTPDGVLRGWSSDSGNPVIIDKTTGALTSVASSLYGPGTGVAWQDAAHSYIKHENQLYSVNVDTGASTLLGSVVPSPGVILRNLLENDPNGGLISSDRKTFYHIDPDTLTLTTLSTGLEGINFSAIAFSTASVDEPPAMAILGLALAGLGWHRRRSGVSK